MKAVLISIQPKWCELIASGIKTIEVRKTKPKIDVPFKCYIYESKGARKFFSQPLPIPYYEGKGKVIGEFVCNEIECFTTDYRADDKQNERISKQSCVPMIDLMEYESNAPCLYGWHISNLIIYDKPKELREFYNRCYSGCDNCKYQSWDYSYAGGKDLICTCRNEKPIKRPPQSWCYVEEKECANIA